MKHSQMWVLFCLSINIYRARTSSDTSLTDHCSLCELTVKGRLGMRFVLITLIVLTACTISSLRPIPQGSMHDVTGSATRPSAYVSHNVARQALLVLLATQDIASPKTTKCCFRFALPVRGAIKKNRKILHMHL